MNKNNAIRNFFPLLALFLLVLVLALIRPIILHSWNLHDFMSDFMGAFFIIIGSLKVYNLSAFAQAYASYDLIAQRSSLYAHLYPFLELILGICYAARFYLPIINITTIIFMLIGAVGVTKVLLQKKTYTCACLGMVFRIPMTYVTLVEDLLMAAMAAYMLTV